MFKWFKSKKNEEKIKEEVKDEVLDTEVVDETEVEGRITEELDDLPEKPVLSDEVDDNNLTAGVQDSFYKDVHKDLSDVAEDVVIEGKEINATSSEIEEIDEEEVVESRDDKEEVDTTEAGDEKVEKVGFFKGLFSGLEKTRKNIGSKIDNLINNYGEIDDELFEELEEILIMADISYESVMKLIDSLKEELVRRKIKDVSLVKSVLRDVMAESLEDENSAINLDEPTVIMVIGVNGAGKTTTIGKLASKYSSDGKKVILAAADTFRAAAIDQLKVWAERSETTFISHEEGSDPSAVIFDGLRAAKARKADVLICDTAGRLHNKVNLMNELKKMHGIIDREFPEANKEVLLVLDATTGQNAVNQAKLFKEVADITGLVITKLDGTAKGGFVFSIKDELDIPVKLIGVGEKIGDLREFNAQDYASAIVSKGDSEE